MKTQSPRKHDDKKTTATVESQKDTESSMSMQPVLSLCSSNDLKLPSTRRFMDPSQGIYRLTSMSPGDGRKSPRISLEEVTEPIDKWISKAMERIESALGDIKADTIEDGDSDDNRFNFSLVERLQEQAIKSDAHERSLTELPELLPNPKKTEAKAKQRPKETQKETTAKMKSHLRAISELRPKHYNLIEKKGKPRHKRDNDSEVPLDIVKAQSELIHSLSDQNSSKENTRRLSKLLSDADLPQAQTPEDGVKTVGDNRKKSEMSSANQKKESEAFRSFLLTINEFKSKIQEKDVEIEKEEKSLAELGGGPHLKQQVEELRIQLQEEPTSPEIQKANERNRVLTRERDEHLALTGDLIKENVELREKIRQRNEQLSKLSAIIQNHASQRA